MCSLVGAVSAARVGRGIRCTEKPAEDYQVVLPHLPTGASVLNTVFLHADVKARPYRVEHVRDSLARLSLLPEVVALGAYQMNHLWAVTFKDEEGKRKILEAEAFNVKDHRCMVIDPRDRGVRLKLYWLLHGVPDEDVRVALAPFGKVTEISRDKWKVKGCIDKGSTTRSVTLKLNVGLTVDDLPHQLRVAEDMALVFVPGRAPLCLRCRGIGHIRRECRVPRCGVCRRFGHDDSQCVRSYASVTGPLQRDVVSEHMMDAADAEEASREDNDVAKTPAVPLEPSPGAVQEATLGGEPLAAAPETKPETATCDAGVNAASASSSLPQEVGQEATDVEMITTGSIAAKRAHEDTGNAGITTASGTGEPPTKASTTRRSMRKPQPNVPPGSRVAPKTPPP
ncbi:uncharacterized protein [Dermacentor albipictus]|uniref:uncharacterized protein n=1 Tax=Dermacentor albipictus TaxID=60249 RepID=UPI0031FD975D